MDLVVYAMERSETEEQFDDGGTSQLLWQHLSSQLIFFVLFQFASFPHMVLSLHQKVRFSGPKPVFRSSSSVAPLRLRSHLLTAIQTPMTYCLHSDSSKWPSSTNNRERHSRMISVVRKTHVRYTPNLTIATKTQIQAVFKPCAHV